MFFAVELSCCKLSKQTSICELTDNIETYLIELVLFLNSILTSSTLLIISMQCGLEEWTLEYWRIQFLTLSCLRQSTIKPINYRIGVGRERECVSLIWQNCTQAVNWIWSKTKVGRSQFVYFKGRPFSNLKLTILTFTYKGVPSLTSLRSFSDSLYKKY